LSVLIEFNDIGDPLGGTTEDTTGDCVLGGTIEDDCVLGGTIEDTAGDCVLDGTIE
jgi:hypothetical protein